MVWGCLKGVKIKLLKRCLDFLTLCFVLCTCWSDLRSVHFLKYQEKVLSCFLCPWTSIIQAIQNLSGFLNCLLCLEQLLARSQISQFLANIIPHIHALVSLANPLWVSRIQKWVSRIQGWVSNIKNEYPKFRNESPQLKMNIQHSKMSLLN